MIRYSHVRLLVLSDAENVDVLTQLLGIKPSEIEFDKNAVPPPTRLTHTWCLDSPMGTEGDPTARLEALAEIIEPFANRLVSIDTRFPRFIDIVYHVTPQHVGGITGEFDWFRYPAKLMAKISGWNLDVSYETFWFDHPDWARRNLPWWRQLFASRK